MFTSLIDKAKNQFKNKLPFVLYRKPNSENISGGFQRNDALNLVKDYKEKGFVFAPFHTNSPSILLHLDEHLNVTITHKKQEQNTILDNKQEIIAKEFHVNLIIDGIKSIQNNRFKKVVLSRKLEIEFNDCPFDFFTKLLNKYNGAFCYIWYHPKVGMWLGATPEILLRLENKKLTTMSLAGTKPFTKGVKPLWGTKELEEQKMVTSYIIDALKDKVGKISTSDVQNIKAGNLWHLRTKLTAITNNNSLEDIIKALHPTPAVCGLPKKEALQFINDKEVYNREFYTGYLGELNIKVEQQRLSKRINVENRAYKTIKTSSELYVNLRCMQLKDKNALIYVGGGITKDSIPEKEWEETVNKSKTMLSILS